MSPLLDCSHEVLHNILIHVDPADLAALSVSSKSLHEFLLGNTLLCKALVLTTWDPPATQSGIDWPSLLRNLVRLDKVLRSPSRKSKQDSLTSVGPLILSLLSSTRSRRNIAYLSYHFTSSPNWRPNTEAFLARSSLYRHAGPPSQACSHDPGLRALSARLHVHFGIPIDLSDPDPPFPHPLLVHDDCLPSRSPYHISWPRSGSGTPPPPPPPSAYAPANNLARAKVYDLREYTDASAWGPFQADGSMRVDWEKMEAVMVLLAHNIWIFSRETWGAGGLWYGPWEGVGTGTFQEPDWSRWGDKAPRGLSRLAVPRGVVPAELAGEEGSMTDESRRQKALDERDPYGISGTWMRVVCFLDYNDLYAYNFAGRRERRREEGIDTKEAIRLIKLNLKVTKVVTSDAHDGDGDGDVSGDYHDDAGTGAPRPERTGSRIKRQRRDEGPDKLWPKAYFTGSSRSLHSDWDPRDANASSKIRGVVQMTEHGDVRWTTWSIFHGEERWRSEGVQVGGPRSGRGVLGNWFDKDYEEQGPAGPTAFWKVSDHPIADVREDIEPLAYPLRPPFGWPEDDDDGDE